MDEEKLISSIENLIKVETELTEAVGKKKNTWEIFRIISTFISGVIIAGVGLYFTTIYDQHEARIRTLESHEKFIQHLSNDSTRALAFLALKEMGNNQFALQVGKIYGFKDISEPADEIMAGATKVELTKTTPPVKTKITKDKEIETGWAYLGQYSDNKWVTRYLDFINQPEPDSLVGNTYEVGGMADALNIRENMPSTNGAFHKILAVLKYGSSVKIQSVHEWWNSGFMWARVQFTSY